MSLSRKHAFPLSLSVLFLALAQPAHSSSQPEVSISTVAAPLAAERQLPLAWGEGSEARLQPVASAWQLVARLQFLAAASHVGTARRDSGVNRTGPLSWTVTSGGTQVLDSNTGAVASIPALTSAEVRPRDILYDKQSGTVWIYGEGLYRYTLASRLLEKLQPSGESWSYIRKVARGQAGLWVAAGSGIYLLDAADGALKSIYRPATAGARVINMAAGDRDAWFATADGRVIHAGTPAPGRFVLTTSAVLPGAAAELAVAGQTAWLLLSDRHGDYYKLAFIDERRDRLGIMPGKYFLLAEQNGRLTAGAYAMAFRIDPENKTLTPVKTSEAGLLAQAVRTTSVLYAGSSYDVRDGCEVVEHGQPDISKGWTTAMGEPLFR